MPREAKRDASLLERRRHHPALALHRAGDDADVIGPRLPGREQLLDVARRRLSLGSLRRRAPEADRARVVTARGASRPVTAAAARASLPPPRREPASGHPLGVGVAREEGAQGARAAERADRLELVAGDDEVAVLGGERLEQALLRRARVLELVRDHLGEALGESVAHVGAALDEAAELVDEVDRVEAARVAHDRVVAREELGELDLAPSRVALGVAAAVGRVALEVGGPGPQRVRAHPLALERVYALEQARQQARRVAADLLAAQRQLVDALEQDREAVGGADGLEEGVEAGVGRVLAQQALAERRVGPDPQLLEGDLEQGLDAAAQPRGGRGACG